MARNNICIIGLDRAGKSVIRNYLLTGKADAATKATLAFDISKYSDQNIFYSIVDFPGQTKLRIVWPQQYKYAKIVLYVVDASDAARFEESKKELDGLIANELLKNVPILFLFNKCDLPDSKANIEKAKKMFNLKGIKDRSVMVFETSINDPKTLDDVKQTMILMMRTLVMD
jgi:GTP-binding protein SAR1